MRDGTDLSIEKLQDLGQNGGRYGVLILWHYGGRPETLKIIPCHIAQNDECETVLWTPDNKLPGKTRQYYLHQVLGTSADNTFEAASHFSAALVAADEHNITDVFEEVMLLAQRYQS